MDPREQNLVVRKEDEKSAAATLPGITQRQPRDPLLELQTEGWRLFNRAMIEERVATTEMKRGKATAFPSPKNEGSATYFISQREDFGPNTYEARVRGLETSERGHKLYPEKSFFFTVEANRVVLKQIITPGEGEKDSPQQRIGPFRAGDYRELNRILPRAKLPEITTPPK